MCYFSSFLQSTHESTDNQLSVSSHFSDVTWKCVCAADVIIMEKSASCRISSNVVRCLWLTEMCGTAAAAPPPSPPIKCLTSRFLFECNSSALTKHFSAFAGGSC
ncbi:hypothetical protein E3U43_001542 [Larimichthys crocea]|uniref:Uncharacterized protein n=1 Tax=Larimichthys crocea TaxID=215358 RepID=A0ACD3RDG1_LARCR|nr:hypothetical protein E3U43_001542 [Larimichthys crocea]